MSDEEKEEKPRRRFGWLCPDEVDPKTLDERGLAERCRRVEIVDAPEEEAESED